MQVQVRNDDIDKKNILGKMQPASSLVWTWDGKCSGIGVRSIFSCIPKFRRSESEPAYF